MIDTVYHLQHINALHSSFKRWLMTFNGVYTKYINNYLAWIKFLQLSKKNKKNELTELISVAQEVLSTIFNSSEIRDNVKEGRFSKGYECPKCQC